MINPKSSTIFTSIADKLISNTKYETQFKIPEFKEKLLKNKYSKIICEICAKNV